LNWKFSVKEWTKYHDLRHLPPLRHLQLRRAVLRAPDGIPAERAPAGVRSETAGHGRVPALGEAMRRRARTDANQAEIVNALRQAGAFVQSLAEIGDGCPDLLVSRAGKTYLLEVKDHAQPPSKRQLTDDQMRWHGAWRGGALAIVCDVESALRAVEALQ
jgi:hypothetical protein